MNPAMIALSMSIVLLVGILVCYEIGYRVGLRRSRHLSDAAYTGMSAIEAAVFGLLGLILAFAFGGASSRLDARRHLAIDEANAIGTAYLRVGLLQPSEQPAIRDLFRKYLDTRLRYYQDLSDLDAAKAQSAEAGKLQDEIWTRVQTACKNDSWTPAAILLLPALNQMIDITTTRSTTFVIHEPPAIIALLLVLALISAILAGYTMSVQKSRSPLHMILFGIAISITAYTVLDLDYPRFGLIRENVADKALIDLRSKMN
jgi:hypothetical protein